MLHCLEIYFFCLAGWRTRWHETHQEGCWQWETRDICCTHICLTDWNQAKADRPHQRRRVCFAGTAQLVGARDLAAKQRESPQQSAYDGINMHINCPHTAWVTELYKAAQTHSVWNMDWKCAAQNHQEVIAFISEVILIFLRYRTLSCPTTFPTELFIYVIPVQYTVIIINLLPVMETLRLEKMAKIT